MWEEHPDYQKAQAKIMGVGLVLSGTPSANISKGDFNAETQRRRVFFGEWEPGKGRRLSLDILVVGISPTLCVSAPLR